MKSIFKFLATSAVVNLAVLTAEAANIAWSFDSGVSRVSVLEKSLSGDTLVEELGWQPHLEFGLIKPLAGSPGSITANAFLSSSTLDYDGQSQNGTAIETHTDYRRARLNVGYLHPLTETLDIALSYTLEKSTRDIQSQGALTGLNEEYRQQFLEIGITKKLTINNGPATLDINAATLTSGSQHVSAAGVIDRTTLPIDEANGIRIKMSIPLSKKPAQSIAIKLIPSMEFMHTPRSRSRPWRQNGQLRGSLSQPEMETLRIGLAIQSMW